MPRRLRKRLPLIAAWMTMVHHHTREVLLGIRTYERTRGPWELLPWTAPDLHANPPFQEFAGRLDGVIAFLTTPADEERLAALNVPVINVSARMAQSRFVRVVPDSREGGRMAARHLLERGFRHFAALGHAELYYAQLRVDGFVEEIAARGFSCAVRQWSNAANAVAWLRTQAHPLGVIVPNDGMGAQLLAALNHGDRRSADTAVVSVENDVCTCELSVVPLSSVDTHSRQVGMVAAQTLERMIAGESVPQTIWIKPRGMVERASTQLLPVGNPVLASAVAYIARYACSGITVADICREARVARRTLERLMRVELHCAPHELIHRRQMERAEELLATTHLTTKAIAGLCGYQQPSYFVRVFNATHGCSCREFRRRYMGQSATPPGVPE